MKISSTQYAKTLLELTKDKSEEESLAIVVRFVGQLKADGQLKNAEKIMEKYIELYNISHGIIVAEVTTMETMGKEMNDGVEKFVKDKYAAKEVVINNVVSEGIQGGIVIRVGDEVLDASIGNQLKKLQKVLEK